MKYGDLELTFMFVASEGLGENIAYLSRSTGETFWYSDATGVDDLPEDVVENDDYVEVPHRYELGLGKELVWDFVAREIPERENEVRRIFSRKGAYGRYKSFLERLGLLDTWYKYEAQRTKDSLVAWCRAVGIPIEP